MKRFKVWGSVLPLVFLGICVAGGVAWAQEAASAAVQAAAPAAKGISPGLFAVNNLWVMLAGCLVFTMHLGFATLESGLTRSKNTINILFKNSWIICIGFLTYALCGFSLMYPGFAEGALGILGWGGFGITKAIDDMSMMGPGYADGGYTWYTDFFFQAVFAATAATIVSGAVAERIKLSSFMLWSTIFVAISYPITGSWKWGGGWLDQLGFYDFAGSTLVHSVGGWAALVGAIILGPRLGKYVNGKVHPILGHSLPLATIGVFLLWFGWFGFNAGSVLSANPALISLVIVTTSLAAAAGGVAATFICWGVLKKPDLSMVLNGILAGLVGITAGADLMSIQDAVFIGLIAGTIVVFSVIFFDKIKVDDPVGAISVHLVCGIWGTLAVGLFGDKAGLGQVGNQLIGIVSIGAFTLIFATLLFLIIKATMGLRVSAEEEVNGLDMGEHGAAAYPDFARSHSGTAE